MQLKSLCRMTCGVPFRISGILKKFLDIDKIGINGWSVSYCHMTLLFHVLLFKNQFTYVSYCHMLLLFHDIVWKSMYYSITVYYERHYNTRITKWDEPEKQKEPNSFLTRPSGNPSFMHIEHGKGSKFYFTSIKQRYIQTEIAKKRLVYHPVYGGWSKQIYRYNKPT